MKAPSICTHATFWLLATAASAVECSAAAAAFPPNILHNTAGVQIEPAEVFVERNGEFRSPVNEANFKLLQAAGVGLVRALFAWRRIETDPGRYDWDYLDAFLEQAARTGIRLQIYLTGDTDPVTQLAIPGPYPHSSYGDQTNFIDPFTRFCRTVVEHCTEKMNKLSQKHRVQYPGAALPITWEVWNEPNLGTMTAEQYMVMANSVFPAIRDADRRHRGQRAPATFVAPALAIVNRPDAPQAARGRNALQYLEECLDYHGNNRLGLAELVDGISIHPYRPENPESIVAPLLFYPEYAPATYSDIRSVTKGRLPIVAGEWGYSTVSDFWGTSISLQMQADYLARMNLVNLSERIPYTIWFFLSSSDIANDGRNNFGILYADGSPRPSYYALKTLTSTLSRARFDTNLRTTDPRGPNWLVFRTPTPRGGEKKILVAWNAANENSVSTDSGWGTYTLAGTPLYVGQRLAWLGGARGKWSQRNAWIGGSWPNQSKLGDNYQAEFNNSATIDVDSTYRVSGLHFNANDVLLIGDGALHFTEGGGNLHTGSNNGTIACVISGGGERSTFVLRKSGAGILGLGAANTFTGRVLIKQGALAMGTNQSLGPASNALTLDGGELIMQGYDLATTSRIEIAGTGSIISNYTSNTASICRYPYAEIQADFAIVGNPSASIELAGPLRCPTIHTLTKLGKSSLTLSGGGGDGNLGLVVHNGTVNITAPSEMGKIRIERDGILTLASGGTIGTSSREISLSGVLFHNSTTPLKRTISFLGTESTFGGTGWYGHDLEVIRGHISPGEAGVGSIGTLTIAGDLMLGPDAHLDFDFATPDSDQLHFATNDHTLILDGVLNITGQVTPHGSYPIITNIGHYRDKGLVLGKVPPGNWSYRFLTQPNHTFSLYIVLK